MISPTGGGPLGLEQKPIIWQDFCQKLHEGNDYVVFDESERNWTERGCVPSAPMDPPVNYVGVGSLQTKMKLYP